MDTKTITTVRVYGIRIKDFKDDQSESMIKKTKNNEDFMYEAEKEGLIWSIQGFEQWVNSGGKLDNYIIRFIQPYPMRIGLTYEDLDDLTQDKAFDWILDGIDVHLYNEDENPN